MKPKRNTSLYNAERALDDTLELDDNEQLYFYRRGMQKTAKMTYAFCWQKLCGIAEGLKAAGYDVSNMALDKEALWGTEKAYRALREAALLVEQEHEREGLVLSFLLTPELIAYEGSRAMIETEKDFRGWYVDKCGRGMPYHILKRLDVNGVPIGNGKPARNFSILAVTPYYDFVNE